jgi:hypothetical protein
MNGFRAWPIERLGGYWCDAARPLPSLVFVAPLLAIYEAGLLLLGPQAMRNGADVWLRWMLHALGFSQYFLLPLLTCGLLLAWHHLRRDRWRIQGQTLYGMLLESILGGGCLLLAALVHRACCESMPTLAIEAGRTGELVSYLGAGIYEELLFRLMLLPLLVLLVRSAGAPAPVALIWSILAGSLLFAAAHYRLDLQFGPWAFDLSSGETFDWASFCFRLLAGGFFSCLFWFRGFGVAVGAHAVYDLLATW